MLIKKAAPKQENEGFQEVQMNYQAPVNVQQQQQQKLSVSTNFQHLQSQQQNTKQIVKNTVAIYKSQ